LLFLLGKQRALLLNLGKQWPKFKNAPAEEAGASQLASARKP